ncbi:hypothetical protein PVK06_006800 [Gossypium arboreum]|uniref:Uncharacterized protein n=1 Tax=Gossypium arboreum TaxID=29729 RepID=A0ABR0QGW2_GOSAR|nr:hypothetical protein PVK06_006800 [Gossypium arboreum]
MLFTLSFFLVCNKIKFVEGGKERKITFTESRLAEANKLQGLVCLKIIFTHLNSATNPTPLRLSQTRTSFSCFGPIKKDRRLSLHKISSARKRILNPFHSKGKSYSINWTPSAADSSPIVTFRGNVGDVNL